MISEYRHSYSSFALEKASTNIRDTDRNRRGLLPGNHQVTPGHRETRRRRGHRGSSAPGLQRQLQRPIRKNSKGKKAGEYLIYPRVLRPATKLLCIINGYRGSCIVDCKVEIPR